jgi:hypothetical protein
LGGFKRNTSSQKENTSKRKAFPHVIKEMLLLQRKPRKHAAKSQSTLEGKSVSADGKETAKAKLKRNNSSNSSLSSIIKAGHKAEDSQCTAEMRRIEGDAAAAVEPNESFSSCVEHEDSNCRERPPQSKRFKVVSEQMYQCRLRRNDLSIRLSPLLNFCRCRRTTAGDFIRLPVVCAAAAAKSQM